MGFAHRQAGAVDGGPRVQGRRRAHEGVRRRDERPDRRAPRAARSRRRCSRSFRSGTRSPARWRRSTPPEVLMLVVHGEQDMRVPPADHAGHGAQLDAPPRSASTSSRTARRSSRKVETRDETGDARRRAVHDVLLPRRQRRRGRGRGRARSTSSEERRRRPSRSARSPSSSTRTRRTATREASGDNMPIHLDEEIAKSVGLPGIIIHGLCTMAFTSLGGDPGGRRRRPDAAEAARGALLEAGAPRAGRSRPRSGPQASATANQVFGFETRNGDGEVVIKDGARRDR